MRGYWAQPSLSRDFALLSVAVLFVLVLISGWVSYSTYEKHSQRITVELEKEAQRIERALDSEMNNASYMLTALGKQIVVDQDRSLVSIAQKLKAFYAKGYIYAIFTLVSPQEKIVVSSNLGVLDPPVDASDRDYVKKAAIEPWKMHIGRPVQGHVSNRWIIPTAMGLTDYTGKFIGTLNISIDIKLLTARIHNLAKREGISFSILSKNLIPLTDSAEDNDFVTNNFLTQKLINVNFSQNPSGLISNGSLFWGIGTFSYYRISPDYPYIVLLGYDTQHGDELVRNILWSRLLQMMMIGMFFVLFLWIMRVRMIKPVMEMTSIAASLAKGDTNISLPKAGAIEIEGLAHQIRRISEYVKETRRIEEELRNKILMLRRSREQTDMKNRSKSELLASVCHDLQQPLNNMIGAAEAMRDQLYGPIENRKYKQYALDIHATSTQLLESVRDVLTWSKAETSYLQLNEKLLDVAGNITKVMRFMADKIQASKLNVKLSMQEPLPKLVADEFRFQQMLSNLMLHLFEYAEPESTLLLEIKTVIENKDKIFFVISLTTAEDSPHSPAQLVELAERLAHTPAVYLSAQQQAEALEKSNINLELVKTIVSMHQGYFDISQNEQQVTTATIIFGPARIRFVDSANR